MDIVNDIAIAMTVAMAIAIDLADATTVVIYCSSIPRKNINMFPFLP